jgi:hypothetical protein
MFSTQGQQNPSALQQPHSPPVTEDNPPIQTPVDPVSLLAQIYQMQGSITQLTAALAHTSVSAPAVSSTHQKSPKIKEPETFDGGCDNPRIHVWNFLSQCELYISCNRQGFTSDEHQVLWVASYLRGDAYAWVSAYLNVSPEGRALLHMDWLRNWSAFRSKLQETFSDPDEDHTNASKLTNLRQQGSAAVFAADFQCLSFALDWDDKALAFLFYKGLKENVKDELSHVPRIEALDELVEMARACLLGTGAGYPSSGLGTQCTGYGYGYGVPKFLEKSQPVTLFGWGLGKMAGMVKSGFV